MSASERTLLLPKEESGFFCCSFGGSEDSPPTTRRPAAPKKQNSVHLNGAAAKGAPPLPASAKGFPVHGRDWKHQSSHSNSSNIPTPFITAAPASSPLLSERKIAKSQQGSYQSFSDLEPEQKESASSSPDSDEERKKVNTKIQVQAPSNTISTSSGSAAIPIQQSGTTNTTHPFPLPKSSSQRRSIVYGTPEAKKFMDLVNAKLANIPPEQSQKKDEDENDAHPSQSYNVDISFDTISPGSPSSPGLPSKTASEVSSNASSTTSSAFTTPKTQTSDVRINTGNLLDRMKELSNGQPDSPTRDDKN